METGFERGQDTEGTVQPYMDGWMDNCARITVTVIHILNIEFRCTENLAVISVLVISVI